MFIYGSVILFELYYLPTELTLQYVWFKVKSLFYNPALFALVNEYFGLVTILLVSGLFYIIYAPGPTTFGVEIKGYKQENPG